MTQLWSCKFAQASLPVGTGVGGGEGGARLVFDGEFLRRVDADVGDGVSVVGGGGELEFGPRDAVVGGVKKAEVVATGPDIGAGDGDDAEVGVVRERNGDPSAGFCGALEVTAVGDAEVRARGGGGDEAADDWVRRFERTGEAVARFHLNGLRDGGCGARSRFLFSHDAAVCSLRAEFGLELGCIGG